MSLQVGRQPMTSINNNHHIIAGPKIKKDTMLMPNVTRKGNREFKNNSRN
jgi:hypothetical protein